MKKGKKNKTHNKNLLIIKICFFISDHTIWIKNQPFSATCPIEKSGKISIIVHGWMGSKMKWMNELTNKFLKYRGGCTIIMNWGSYSDNLNYVDVVENKWYPVASILEKRIRQIVQEGFLLENFLLYGHSLGAWMVIEVGTRFGDGKIGYVDGEYLTNLGYIQ